VARDEAVARKTAVGIGLLSGAGESPDMYGACVENRPGLTRQVAFDMDGPYPNEADRERP